MDNKSKSILSSAALIGEILSEDPDVMSEAKMFYPVIAPEKAVCPYVVYRRAKTYTKPDSSGGHADTADIEVLCCGSGYGQSVKIAEAVKNSLDGIQAISGDGKLKLRSCFMTDSSEAWESQTFIQILKFTVKINKI